MQDFVGDFHNFGECVYTEGDLVFKPRTVLWEKMFLSPCSELRVFINKLCYSNQVPSPFDVAPSLQFSVLGKSKNVVERLKLNHEINGLVPSEINSIAAMIGMCYWFGIGDLHRENVFIGRTNLGNLICFPIDIEIIFEKMTHVKQTLLFPIERLDAEKCGLMSILKLIKNLTDNLKIDAIKSFIKMINLLNLHFDKINTAILSSCTFDEGFIRVILRDTKKYNDILNGKEICLDLIREEKIQLDRREIPYFFRRLNSNTVYYYKNELKELAVVKELPISTNKSTSITLHKSCQIDSIKTHTAIYSCAYIAELFGLSVKHGLTNCSFFGDGKIFKVFYDKQIEIYEAS